MTTTDVSRMHHLIARRDDEYALIPDLMDDPIPRILAKLKTVRKRRLKSFGWQTHKFLLKEPLSKEVVQAYEQKHGITLPEDFRRFVLEVGGSGAGPYYGLLPMEQWWTDFASSSGDRAADCPMVPGMPAPNDQDSLSERLLDGTITIVEQGCSFSTVLVISGPYRGRLVNFDAEGGAPYFTRDPGFLAWYERWLDEMLAGWNTAEFGVGMPGDSAKMLKVLTCAESTADDRKEALRTVARIPCLSEPLAKAVLARLSDVDSGIRATSVWIASKRRIPRAESAIRGLCGDDAAAVRRTALNALRDLRANDWSIQARYALTDSDPEVCRTALYLLAEARLLTREDLEPLISDASVEKRRAAISAWGKSGFKVSNTSWIEARIHDDDPEVIRCIICAASASRDRAFLPRLNEIAQRQGGKVDSLTANVRARLKVLVPLGWISGIVIGVVGSIIAYHHPDTLVFWAAVGILMGVAAWSRKPRRRRWC